MNLNGHDPLQAALESAKQQQEQQQMLLQMLQQALNQPLKVTKVTGPHLVTLAEEADGTSVLLVSHVNGERWDIPMDDATCRRIAFALARSSSEKHDPPVDGELGRAA